MSSETVTPNGEQSCKCKVQEIETVASAQAETPILTHPFHPGNQLSLSAKVSKMGG